jgi:hypothetical protein
VIRVCGFIQHGLGYNVRRHCPIPSLSDVSHGRREWRSEDSQRGFPMRISSWDAAVIFIPRRRVDARWLSRLTGRCFAIPAGDNLSSELFDYTLIVVPTHRIPRPGPQYHPIPLLHLSHERVFHAQHVAVGLEVLSS